ncbi:hotdog domain-containing protein [Nocardioides sp.]|uniref:PaaI family thioesterase n=1 Tax=Nocardioides sp. TaxID=35761 RepID=UPI002613BAF8|nr:hotdog domain-containing protein [Nocardioides sp.]MDI6909234.1 thioesterase family protein [Nocardioides sp.]
MSILGNGVATIDEERRRAVASSIRASRGGPERAFGDLVVELVDPTDDRGVPGAGGLVEAHMHGSGVRFGPDGLPAAGSIGVLVDDALGFAIIGASTGHLWSVSLEVSIDFLHPLPSAPLRLLATGRPGNEVAGYGHGAVTTSDGTVVAHARQHGRYVPAPHSFPELPASSAERFPDTIEDLLATEVHHVDGAVVLRLADAGPWLNGLGVLHGGVAICAAEAAAAHATLDAATTMQTTSMTLAFTRPMSGEHDLEFRARTLHGGRTARVIEVVGYAGDRPSTFARIIRQAL